MALEGFTVGWLDAAVVVPPFVVVAPWGEEEDPLPEDADGPWLDPLAPVPLEEDEGEVEDEDVFEAGDDEPEDDGLEGDGPEDDDEPVEVAGFVPGPPP